MRDLGARPITRIHKHVKEAMSSKPFIPLFRVYDKDTGVLHQFDPIMNTDTSLIHDGVITTHSGYYDRYGKPIFEGDKIKNAQHPYELPVCHGPWGWYAGTDEGGIDITMGGFFSSHEDGTPRYERCGWLKDVEITGNIWKA